MKVLVAGIGNVFFGDDGIGVAVVETLRRSATDDPLPDGVRVMDVGIRGVHLSFELMDGYDVVVLVDAAPRGERPGTVTVLEPDVEDSLATARARQAGGEAPLIDAHGMGPVDVLAVLDAVREQAAAVRMVVVEPEHWAEGIGLSPTAQAAVPVAAAQVRRVIAEAMAGA